MFVIDVKNSNTISMNNISMSFDVFEFKKYEELVERSLVKDASFLARIEFLKFNIDVIGESKKKKKFKLDFVVVKRTLSNNFEDILTLVRTTSCIL